MPDQARYEKCLHCHLFVGRNDGDDMPPYEHYHRGDAADSALDGSHNPTPSGDVRTLSDWMENGPAEMRARFNHQDDPTTHTERG